MSYFPRRKELVSGLKIRPSNLLLNLGDEKILPFHSAKEMQVALRWIANYSWHFYILPTIMHDSINRAGGWLQRDVSFSTKILPVRSRSTTG